MIFVGNKGTEKFLRFEKIYASENTFTASRNGRGIRIIQLLAKPQLLPSNIEMEGVNLRVS